MDFLNELEKIPGMKDFVEMIRGFLEMDTNSLNENSFPAFLNAIEDNFSGQYKEDMIKNILSSYKEVRAPKNSVIQDATGIRELINNIESELEKDTDKMKMQVISLILDSLSDIVMEASETYDENDIVVHVELVHDNAKLPAYSNENAVCADIFFPEDITVPARTRGMIVKTGLKIAVEPGWCVKLYPRSSTGVKTPIRISNSVGIIESDYRDEVGFIVDNTSSKPYTIQAGNRMAQMEVTPRYRAKFSQIDNINDIEGNRGGGYGSTGE